MPMVLQQTRYYQPYFLEDRSGRLSGSEFNDIHERLKFSYRCSRRSSTLCQYTIFETTSPREDACTTPVSVLEYGPNNTLGLVYYGMKPQSMARYLVKVDPEGSSRHRKFVAQDGRTYIWSYRTHEDHEWTCVDSSGSVVAFYHLKLAGEPSYPNSSGCMLTVEEAYGDYAYEFLTSCLIMRHIAEHNL
ncbi:hypothetical protein CC1G_09302 [Coprinopsis cinerea okayama7|uniref:DUF6593 domain-containing protein n=1 Tax=Coprinopsis cinerea (strain Okayama-7 / 130 / ATCC MYA-4618 / FGSC 9003) TaxID=240176 RepID=A8N881_COPC7|nr:hypothetical protein CC1G_09302 [Coprinopsis cinerea okayama7\|eukprot:XP_001831037.2 hypothetical protein CC1G_09302 [Coprinopsis cinerea okayama7\